MVLSQPDTTTAGSTATAVPPVSDNHKRRMLHLKTKEECRLGNETIQVWTVELPSKHAEGILKVIKEQIEGQDNVDLQHLRRFAKPKYLPKHVIGKRDLIKEMYSVPRGWESSPPTVIQAPSASWEWSSGNARKRGVDRSLTLYLLVCPSNIIPLREVHDLMLQHPPFCSSADSWAYPLEIKEVTVPRLAPTSPEQADEWSDQYWPTFYRKTNPFGAHPTSIGKAEADLEEPVADNVSVSAMMELAEQAGTATEKLGYGIGTGCVIVERADDQTEIIAVAGDARGKPLPSEGGSDDANIDTSFEDAGDKKTGGAFAKKTARKRRKKKEQEIAKLAETNACTSGNVMCHAVMRAIGMVGRKRLRVASQPISTRAAKAENGFYAAGLQRDEKARDAFFLDLPVTPLEQQYFTKDNLKPDGYLCLKLEIFLTHEPCMMCSMALVHSRVGRVIFKHRMPQTGGLTAEMVRNDSGPVGLGYGLCWRKELNWQFMCWEYTALKYASGSARQHVDGKASAAGHVARRTGATAGVQAKGAGYYGGEIDDDDDKDDADDYPEHTTITAASSSAAGDECADSRMHSLAHVHV
ncbi:hypothetical protein B0A54_04385 [Friedmanniomyces endolithicus]|uniref:Uncharacterized protein n=1 Tax=Friedmanniomyces endolithicus TaxID=329885 RepID=A0A4V5N8W8_9PEZI|nr:hypothetical protein LTS09_010678 [Friedmanniomyces endolithicus]TKA45289.1 hypothetical protein B0A54_04385 [Friedmanniomyces endolithicus]